MEVLLQPVVSWKLLCADSAQLYIVVQPGADFLSMVVHFVVDVFSMMKLFFCVLRNCTPSSSLGVGKLLKTSWRAINGAHRVGL
jgi:hypothetical protein